MHRKKTPAQLAILRMKQRRADAERADREHQREVSHLKDAARRAKSEALEHAAHPVIQDALRCLTSEMAVELHKIVAEQMARAEITVDDRCDNPMMAQIITLRVPELCVRRAVPFQAYNDIRKYMRLK